MARAWQLSDRWKRGAAALLLVLAGGVLSRASPEPQGTPSLEALLGHFAASPGLRAAVEEEKHISLLREPLVSHGTIAFVPPGLLVRVIDEPVSSLLVIDADGLRYEADGQQGALEIRAHPMLRALVDGMRHLFAGDADALRSAFEITWAVDAEDPMAWRLDLRPRDEATRDRVSRLEIRGRGWSLGTLRVVEAAGDETLMRFSDVEMHHVFDEAEIAELLASVTGTGNADR